MIEQMIQFLSIAVISLGCFFIMTGSLGIIRMPDFYTRLHPAGITDSIGAPLILVGLAIDNGLSLYTAKIVILILLLLITGPTACHALAKAAHKKGVKPYTSKKKK